MLEVEKLQKENEALRRQGEEKKHPGINPATLSPVEKLKYGRKANHAEWLRKKGKL
jgi:hypothetical protein